MGSHGNSSSGRFNMGDSKTRMRDIGSQDINPPHVIQRKSHEEDEEDNKEGDDEVE